MDDLAYVLTAQLNDGTEHILDPDKRGWADKKILSQTRIWSLVPKVGGTPVVVQIPENAKPVYKSRVYGKVVGDVKFRAYAIGFKRGKFTYWVWVAPYGVEFGDDPVYASQYLNKLFAEAKAKAEAEAKAKAEAEGNKE